METDNGWRTTMVEYTIMWEEYDEQLYSYFLFKPRKKDTDGSYRVSPLTFIQISDKGNVNSKPVYVERMRKKRENTNVECAIFYFIPWHTTILTLIIIK